MAGTHPAYVSFLAALRAHGMIEQIPQVLYAATTAHARTVTTPVASFSFHQLAPDFFAGYEWSGNESFLLATPEKALVDYLYLSSRRGRRFGTFPELHFGASFRIGRARTWAGSIRDERTRTHVVRKLQELWRGARGHAN